MFDFLSIARALGDENRVRILMALRQRKLCVCQITAFLDLAPSTTSKHLSILRQSRLIESSKQGRWVYYQLAGIGLPETVQHALRWMQISLSDDPAIIRDEARITEILRAEAACGLDEDVSCFHSLEVHLLDQTLEDLAADAIRPDGDTGADSRSCKTNHGEAEFRFAQSEEGKDHD